MMLPFLLLITVLLSSSLSAQNPTDASSEYKLVWEEDFSKDPDGLPNPEKWNYEEGFIRNNEAQYYTKNRLKNARIEHGKLILEVHKDEFPNPFSKGSRTAHYTSASLTTFGIASWKYGKIEVKAMMPSGQGIWPAIWTLGVNREVVHWPRCGEIDILEMFGLQPDIVRGNFHYSLEYFLIRLTHSLHGGRS